MPLRFSSDSKYKCKSSSFLGYGCQFTELIRISQIAEAVFPNKEFINTMQITGYYYKN